MVFNLFNSPSQDEKYKVGQIWNYQTRKGEENSTLIIVGVEKNKKLGTIINIYVDGLKVKNSNVENGFSDKIQHLPFAKDAIDKSVIKLVGIAKELPDYKDGYNEWKSEFENGKAGVFTISVKEAINAMETTLNQGH